MCSSAGDTATNQGNRDMKKLNNLTADHLRTCITDCNIYTRRFFRCWLDGSYKGEEHYTANCIYLKTFNEPKHLRQFVISEWCDYIAEEYDCSTSTVMRHMVSTLTTEELEQLNAELIDDALDLVRDQLEVA